MLTERMLARRSPGVVTLVFALAAAACGPGDPCDALGQLCDGPVQWRAMATRADDAVELDLDGDGTDELVVLTATSRQLALGHASGLRSLVFLSERPVALAGLPGEVAVAVAEPPAIVTFGVDGDGRLARRRELPLTGDPDALWSGDLDDDAAPELVVAHAALGQLAVIDAKTGAARMFAAGTSPVAVAVADLDGDGRLDLVAADYAGEALQVLRGAGGGEFQAARAYAGLGPTSDLVLADHDGDGDIDAIARGPAAASVEIHLNDGAGGFVAPVGQALAIAPDGVGLAVGPVGPGGVAGITVPQDEVLSTWFGAGGHIEEYLFTPASWVGRGTADGLLVGGEGFLGRFTYAQEHAPVELWRDPEVHGKVGGLATGDLDGDGLLDLVTSTRKTLDIFRGAADGGFVHERALALGSTPEVVLVAEVTGDARPDILLADGETVRLVRPADHGTYTVHPRYTPQVAALELTALRTGADAPARIVVVPRRVVQGGVDQAPGAAVLRFAADGEVAEETTIAAELLVHRVRAVDLDGDGVDEPLVAGFHDDLPVLTHLRPDGAGFTPGPEHDLNAWAGQELAVYIPLGLAVGDLDGDDAPEVIVTGDVSVVVSGLAEDLPVARPAPEIGSVTDLRDVDGDGLLDAIHLHSSSFGVMFGLGDGTFAESERHGFPDAVAVALASEAGAAFDVVSVSRLGVAAHRLRDVVRPVAAEDPINFQGRADELVTGDIDRDGHADVVVVSEQWSGGVSVLWGGPDGALARADGFNGTIHHDELAIGDLDGDGFPEVMAMNGILYVDLYRFWPEREELPLFLSLFSLYRIEDLAIADVDGDGHADLLALAYLDYEETDELVVGVAFGLGDLEFTEFYRATGVAAVEHARLSVGDLDGQEGLDLLIRPAGEQPPQLALARGPRDWLDPQALPGHAAVFTPPDAAGRVELLVHRDDEIVRLDPSGATSRLVRDARLADTALRRVADVDADGDHDLLVTSPAGTHVWLHGAHGHRPAFAVPASVLDRIEVADIDGDGRPDLVGLAAGRVAVRLAGERP